MQKAVCGDMEFGNLFDGKYRIIKLLGSGGSGRVYLAENTRVKSLWAIKEIPCDGPAPEQIEREIEVLKKIRHPALPRVVDVLREDGMIYLIEDYFEGLNLDAYLKKHSSIEIDEVFRWADEICEIMEFLHGQSPEPIIYRDLKPSNIILSPEGALRLVDFGSVRRYKAENLSDTVYIGTKGYAAPEQYGTGQTSKLSDIYSFGVTMLQALTGKRPARLAEDLAGSAEYYSSQENEGAVYESIKTVFFKCIKDEPEQRYRDFSEVRSALRAILSVAAQNGDSERVVQTGVIGDVIQTGINNSVVQADVIDSVFQAGVIGDVAQAGIIGDVAQADVIGDVAQAGVIGDVAQAGVVNGEQRSDNKKSPAEMFFEDPGHEGAATTLLEVAARRAAYGAQAVTNDDPDANNGADDPADDAAAQNAAADEAPPGPAGRKKLTWRERAEQRRRAAGGLPELRGPENRLDGVFRCATVSVPVNHDFAFELAYRAADRFKMRVIIIDFDFEAAPSEWYCRGDASYGPGGGNSLLNAIGLAERSRASHGPENGSGDSQGAGAACERPIPAELNALARAPACRGGNPAPVLFNETDAARAGQAAEIILSGAGVMSRFLAEITVHADLCVLLTPRSVYNEISILCFENSHYVLYPGSAEIPAIREFNNAAGLAEGYRGIPPGRFKYVFWGYRSKNEINEETSEELAEENFAGLIKKSVRRDGSKRAGVNIRCYAHSMNRGVKKEYDDIIYTLGITEGA